MEIVSQEFSMYTSTRWQNTRDCDLAHAQIVQLVGRLSAFADARSVRLQRVVVPTEIIPVPDRQEEKQRLKLNRLIFDNIFGRFAYS